MAAKKRTRKTPQAVEAPRAAEPALAAETAPVAAPEPAKPPPSGWPLDFAELTQGLLLEELSPAAVLINSRCEIVHVYGPTARYLEAPTGKPTHDVRLMIPKNLRGQLNGAIARALSQQQPLELGDLRVQRNGTYRPIRVNLKPMQSPDGAEQLLLLLFREPRDSTAPLEPPPGATAEELAELLRATKKHLQETIAALEGSNENLTVSNEELVTLNEELQVANEELETSQVEKQALNKQLEITNKQLEEKVAQLEATNNDVVNLLNCTDIATIFLDRELRVRRFTPAAGQVANLIAADVGRPFAQLRLNVSDDELLADCDRVLREFSPREKEILAEGGRWWLRRVVPYRTLNQRIDGLVLTYNDITQVKQASQQTCLLAAVLMDSTDAIIVHDFQGRISTWNHGAQVLYGYSEVEARQMNIDRLVPESTRTEMRAIWQRIERGEHIESFEARRMARGGEIIDVWISLAPLSDERGRPVAIAKIDRDITQRTRDRTLLEQEVRRRTADLAEQQERLRAIVEGASDAIITIDTKGTIESVNRAAERMFGYTVQEMVGQNIKLLMPSPYRDEHDGYLARFAQTHEKRVIGIGREVEARRKDGTVFPAELAVSEIEHMGLFTGMIRDITERKRLEREVVEIALLEQRRIGQQLHDDCGQQLTALAILSDSLEHSLLEAQSADAPLARKIEEGLKTVLRQVRNISRGLVCAEVSPNGLRAALAELTSRLCETSGVRCALHIDDAVRITDALLATHLYHIAQEACTNALKHARASNIEVALVLREGRTVLEVRDDGVGLPDECEEGLGLRIMRNRAGVIGAELTIEAAAQRRQSEPRGTLVTCTLKPERPHGPSKKQLRRHA